MYSIQELTVHCEAQLKEIKSAMDRNGGYHPEVASLYRGLKRSVAKEVQDSIRRISLQEFLYKGSSTASPGGQYLIPVKLHEELVAAVKDFDISSLISASVVSGWVGGAFDVPIIIDDSFTARRTMGGASAPSTTPGATKATINPKLISANLCFTNDLIEDNGYAIIPWLVKQSAQAIGYASNDVILNVLKTATDGDGTVGASATGDADETLFTGGATSDIVIAIGAIGANRFVANTMIITPESWAHSVGSYAASGWQTSVGEGGFDMRYGFLDTLFTTMPTMHAAADTTAMTDCITVVFDRKNALLTGKKRWMQIENYANPVADISGAVITGRVGAVTLYNDSIYVLTED